MRTEDDVAISILEADPERAIPIIAGRLRAGSLALAIGAGASAGFGLPTWYKLVQGCLRKAGIRATVNERTPNETLRSLTQQAEKKLGKKYRATVRSLLYAGLNYSDAMLKQDLLIALGACMMGSTRGCVREVLNFNFDNVLDWYLNLHGYTTQIISEIPTLRREVDVTIYHNHGYLPKDAPLSAFSDFLVFSQYSYDQKIAKFQTDPWIAHFRHTLRSKQILFVGLSGEDPLFGPLLGEVHPEFQGSRYTGFWFFGPKPKSLILSNLREKGVVPLQFDSFPKIAQYLLRVCQTAAANK